LGKSCCSLLLNVSFLGKLGEEKLEEVLLGDVLKTGSWLGFLDLWNWSWFSDWFWLRNSNLGFLWLWNKHWCLDSWVVIWGTGNDLRLRNWENWRARIELLCWVDVLILVRGTKKWLSHWVMRFWKLVARDIVSFFDDFRWLVLDLSSDLRIPNSFKKLRNLRKGIFKLGLLVLLDLLFCGEANLLQDPLALLT